MWRGGRQGVKPLRFQSEALPGAATPRTADRPPFLARPSVLSRRRRAGAEPNHDRLALLVPQELALSFWGRVVLLRLFKQCHRLIDRGQLRLRTYQRLSHGGHLQALAFPPPRDGLLFPFGLQKKPEVKKRRADNKISRPI